MRIILLAAAVAALAGSASSSHSFEQRGTVATPRAASGDGQPLAAPYRVELHGGATAESTIADERADRSAASDGSAAAVTRKQMGAAVRARISKSADLGIEVDRSWSPTKTTPAGAAIDGPDDAVIDVALGLRASTRLSDGARLGFAMDLGFSSVPITRNDAAEAARAEALLARMAVIPSLRRGVVTWFGSVGFATESEVPSSVIWTDPDPEPDVQASASGLALTIAAGATIDVGGGARLTARVGDAVSKTAAAGHYGPQVDVGLAFDLGK